MNLSRCWAKSYLKTSTVSWHQTVIVVDLRSVCFWQIVKRTSYTSFSVIFHFLKKVKYWEITLSVLYQWSFHYLDIIIVFWLFPTVILSVSFVWQLVNWETFLINLLWKWLAQCNHFNCQNGMNKSQLPHMVFSLVGF